MFSERPDLVLVRHHLNIQTLTCPFEDERYDHLYKGKEMDPYGRVKSHCRVIKAHPDRYPSLRFLQAHDCRFNDPVEIAAFRPLAASLAEVGLVLVDEDDDEYKQEWIE